LNIHLYLLFCYLVIKHSLIFVFSFFDSSQMMKMSKLINSLPVQVTPFPLYPELQAQLKLPGLFVHNAFDEHPPLFVKHSFISI